MDRTKTKLGAPADDATETEQGTALSGRTTKLAKREGGGSRAGLANGATGGQVGGGQVGDDEPFFAIGELADEFAITTRTIRFYEARGLLVPARFRSNRAYSRRDRARLKLILRGKNLGFSLEDIAEYLLLYDS